MATSQSAAASATTGTRYLHIEALITGGGQIMIGTIAPIRGAAVAHDGKKTLVMSHHRPQEALPDLLKRLEAAIALAQSTGECVNEVKSHPRTASTNSDRANAAAFG